ncbi:MAG: gamma-glutamyl-gamma-aminobutyrate hydrolase family protein [Candidatus Sericytochromatia bacterium]|nr:gamma-glutamyl-gamma-aminobutyrate hydrolase family protein [Candidatus Sericytochromatia bacterium]
MLNPRIGVTGVDTYGLRSWKFQRYTAHVRAAGGIPVPLGRRNTVLPAGLSGLLLAGGEDVDPVLYGAEPHRTFKGNRGRDLAEFALARQALGLGMPILAICRGCQLLNVVLGGTLLQDIPSQHPHPLPHTGGVRHAMRIHAGTRLDGLVDDLQVEVNSYHHQAVAELAQGLQPSAVSPDGILEAWEADPDGMITSYVMAVQWHPERAPFNDGISQPLFGDFVTTAARYGETSGHIAAVRH